MTKLRLSNMSQNEKLKYFDKNLKSILIDNPSTKVYFLDEFIGDEKIQMEIKQWPNEIKSILVEKFLTS